MTDTATASKLLELVERLETVASEAQRQLSDVRPRHDGYVASEAQRLSEDLGTLCNRCGNLRYAVTKDVAMPTIRRLEDRP